MGNKTTPSLQISSESLSMQNPVPPSKSKLPLVLLVISLLFIFCLGGIFLGRHLYAPQTLVMPTPALKPAATPITTSDITADWRTYVNSKYKYEFKCPATSVHDIEVTNGDGNSTPYYQEICYEGASQVRVLVVNDGISQAEKDSSIITYKLKIPDSKNVIYLRGFNEDYFNQILPTFKFTR